MLKKNNIISILSFKMNKRKFLYRLDENLDFEDWSTIYGSMESPPKFYPIPGSYWGGLPPRKYGAFLAHQDDYRKPDKGSFGYVRFSCKGLMGGTKKSIYLGWDTPWYKDPESGRMKMRRGQTNRFGVKISDPQMTSSQINRWLFKNLNEFWGGEENRKDEQDYKKGTYGLTAQVKLIRARYSNSFPSLLGYGIYKSCTTPAICTYDGKTSSRFPHLNDIKQRRAY